MRRNDLGRSLNRPTRSALSSRNRADHFLPTANPFIEGNSLRIFKSSRLGRVIGSLAADGDIIRVPNNPSRLDGSRKRETAVSCGHPCPDVYRTNGSDPSRSRETTRRSTTAVSQNLSAAILPNSAMLAYNPWEWADAILCRRLRPMPSAEPIAASYSPHRKGSHQCNRGGTFAEVGSEIDGYRLTIVAEQQQPDRLGIGRLRQEANGPVGH